MSDIIERYEVTSDVLVLRIARPETFSFAPGQRVKLGIGKGKKRPYNLASTPAAPYLEFCIERVSEGRLTPELWQLTPGQQVSLKAKAKGKLSLDASSRHHLMVATITGIAPFRSMVHDALESAPNQHHFTLLHGARHADELVYRNEFYELANAYPNQLTYVPTIAWHSDPRNAAWDRDVGPVGMLAKNLLSQLDPDHTTVYACGHPGMVRTVRSAYGSAHFRVQAEPFWKDRYAVTEPSPEVV